MEEEITMNEIDRKILDYLDRAEIICEESTGVCSSSDEIIKVAKMIQQREESHSNETVYVPYSKEER